MKAKNVITIPVARFSGVILRALRKQRGYSRARLGTMTGINPQTIMLIENSPTSNPTIDTLAPLAAVLGTTIEKLLTMDAPSEPGAV